MTSVLLRWCLWFILMSELCQVLVPEEFSKFYPSKRITIPNDGVIVTHHCYDNGIVSHKDAMRIAGSIIRGVFLKGSWSGLVKVYIHLDSEHSFVLCVLNILKCNSSNTMCSCTGITTLYRYFSVTFRLRPEMNNSKVVISTADEVNFTAVATTIKLEPDILVNVTLNGVVVDVRDCLVRVVENSQIQFTFCVTYALNPHLTFRLNGKESDFNSGGPCASSTMWVSLPLSTLTLSYLDVCGREDSFVCYFYSDFLVYLKFNNKTVDLLNCSTRWPMGSSLTVEFCAPLSPKARLTISFNSDKAKTLESICARRVIDIIKQNNVITLSTTDHRLLKHEYSCSITGYVDQLDDPEIVPYDWLNRNTSTPFLRVSSSVEYIFSSIITVAVILIVAVCVSVTYNYVAKMKRRNLDDDHWTPYRINSRDILGDVYTGPKRIISESTAVTADSSAVDTNSYESSSS